MTGRNRRHFSPEFRLEAAQLVLDPHYTKFYGSKYRESTDDQRLRDMP